MQKIHSLYQHLIEELAADYGKRKQDIHVYAEEGETESYPGADADNKNFKLKYTAVVMLDRCTYNAAQISHVLLQWLNENQPNYQGNTPLKFNAEILSSKHVDLMFSLELTETVKVSNTENGVLLTLANEQRYCPTIPGALDLKIEHDPTGPPLS